MALDKPKKYIPEIQEKKDRHRSKRTRRETECSVKRTWWMTCGICGYEEVVEQGVDWCTVCGKEQEVLSLEEGFMDYEKTRLRCHQKPYQYKDRHGKTYTDYTSAIKRYVIYVCLACGAVKAPACPNCKSFIWKKGMQRYCKHCGYRI